MENNKTNILQNNDLENVSGGGTFDKGTNNRVSSGDNPKFNVGQIVLIKYDKGRFEPTVDCECKVLSVSTEKKGTIWKEFTYSVRITFAPVDDLTGLVLDDVYESALVDYTMG